MLAELAEMSMAVSRAFAEAGIAAARNAASVLGDEAWQSESDRALALTASRHAAEAFQMVSRSLRLTLKLESATAEWLRDARLGLSRKAVGQKSATQSWLADEEERPRPARRSCSDRESECLVEFERAESLPGWRSSRPALEVEGSISDETPPLGNGEPAAPTTPFASHLDEPGERAPRLNPQPRSGSA